jgi:nucleoprotein TPR
LQTELKQVKQQRDELCMSFLLGGALTFIGGFPITVSSQAALQAQISTLSTSQSSSSTEVDNLKRRVEDTEREKRDLVGVISRLKQDSSQREGKCEKRGRLFDINLTQRKFKLFAPT